MILEGASGAGKSTLIHELARLTGNTDLIELHLDDSMDSKSLLGTYVCTDVPGEFRWQPGPLTQAVKQGRWVVIEDIDVAPFEVLSSLVPLMESRRLLLPNQPALHAAPGFRLFGTRTTRRRPTLSRRRTQGASIPADADGDTETTKAQAETEMKSAGAGAKAGAGAGAGVSTKSQGEDGDEDAAHIDVVTGPLASFINSWCRVGVVSLPQREVRDVVMARFPNLPSLIVDGVVATCELLLSGAVNASIGGVGANLYHSRVLSVRNVLRWAARIATLARFGTGIQGFITEQVRDVT